MKLLLDSGSWTFRSPSGGGEVAVIDKDRVCLSGTPLSYGAYECKVPLTPGWVKLDVPCQTEGLAAPENFVTVILSLHQADGSPLRRQYTDVKPGAAKGSLNFSRLFEVPENVAYGVVSLALRCPGRGNAVFTAPELSVAKPPAQRLARVVVTHFGWRIEDVNSRVKSMFGEIGACSPDLVCFGEALFTRGLWNKDNCAGIRTVAEKIGGPVTSMMADLAAKNNTYVAVNFSEVDGGDIFNSTALLDRSGSHVGTYRKVHLPLDEYECGGAPGSEYPVFETDFGKVGLTICWDAAFPEPARCLKLGGAELMVSASIGDFWETDMARARDNGLWFAIAGGNRQWGGPYPPSRIYDPEGRILCSCGGYNDGIYDSYTFSDIDFNRRYYQVWLSVGPCEGEGPNLYPIERRPDTYGRMVSC